MRPQWCRRGGKEGRWNEERKGLSKNWVEGGRKGGRYTLLTGDGLLISWVEQYTDMVFGAEKGLLFFDISFFGGHSEVL